MNWLVLHTLPKKCRDMKPWTAKQHHMAYVSLCRYLLTDDGKKYQDLVISSSSGHMVMVNNFRFIEAGGSNG